MVTKVLDQINPALAWQAWRPSPKDPWNRKWAAHLYRRAAFGASREELLEAERLGPERTVDLLLRGRPQSDETLETLTDVGRVVAARPDDSKQLRGWWIYCMLHGGHPLREKMTLFWHNHFATSVVKVQNPVLMFGQNVLLRAHALGKFGPLLQAVSKDPAMLLWLDSNSNVKGKPNENYARELMELFSLGVGNYTEKDIREAARAFTGWQTDGESPAFLFNSRLHDTGQKKVFGRVGNWNGEDVVRIVLEQPAAARFLVRKLYRAFVSENVEPIARFLAPLADAFRKGDYDITALLRMMLSSRHFYSAYAFRQRIKSPFEYVLGTVRAVYRDYPESESAYRPLPSQPLVNRLDAMGQQLFTPPNVKGWPGARYWLNTSTLLERDNFAADLAMGNLWTECEPRPPTPPPMTIETSAGNKPRPVPQPGAPIDLPEEAAPSRAFDPARLLQEEGVSRYEDVVRVLIELYLPGGVHPDARVKLLAYISDGNPTGPALDRRVRKAVHAILTMAEYQLA